MAKSLKELAKTKPIDKITIKDITDNCGLSKRTFYHNFQDKAELVLFEYSLSLSKVFNSQGFTKLGKKYIDHAAEEREWVSKFIDRILDLGGCVKHECGQTSPVISDVHEYLKADNKESVDGLKLLDSHIDCETLDYATFDLLKDYYVDEEGDMAWTSQQLDLIDRFGINNYLIGQL